MNKLASEYWIFCSHLVLLTYSFLSFNPDPRIRNTFWTLTMGGTIALLPVWATTQYFVQRYLAVRTLKEAKRSVWMVIVVNFFAPM